MGAHQLRGKQQCGAALDVLAVVGVDAVLEAHTRWVRSMIPRSMRPPPPAQDSILQGGEALVERVQEPVDGQGLVVDGGRPGRPAVGSETSCPVASRGELWSHLR